MGIGPVLGDQLAVPAKDGLGSDQERRPAVLRQESAQRTEPRPIGFAEGWLRLVATQDLELVAQHQDLDLLGPARSEEEQEEREDPPNGKVDERPKLVTGSIGLSHGEGAR